MAYQNSFNLSNGELFTGRIEKKMCKNLKKKEKNSLKGWLQVIKMPESSVSFWHGIGMVDLSSYVHKGILFKVTLDAGNIRQVKYLK